MLIAEYLLAVAILLSLVLGLVAARKTGHRWELIKVACYGVIAAVTAWTTIGELITREPDWPRMAGFTGLVSVAFGIAAVSAWATAYPRDRLDK